MPSILRRKAFWLIATPLVLVLLALVFLPSILTLMGLHPRYPASEFELAGRKALIITTSHDSLGEGGPATGVYASEMTIPYYRFLDAGMEVDVASIRGGAIPVEPRSLRWPLLTAADRRFLEDQTCQSKVASSLPIADLDFTAYDLVYLAGGWGAAYDLGYSKILGAKISEANAAGAVLGSVCHGALGFLQAVDADGAPLVRGRRMTAVTDKQVRELRAAGALYESESAFRDFFAGIVVVDGRLVTGQNQNNGAEVAHRMMELVVRGE